MEGTGYAAAERRVGTPPLARSASTSTGSACASRPAVPTARPGSAGIRRRHRRCSVSGAFTGLVPHLAARLAPPTSPCVDTRAAGFPSGRPRQPYPRRQDRDDPGHRDRPRPGRRARAAPRLPRPPHAGRRTPTPRSARSPPGSADVEGGRGVVKGFTRRRFVAGAGMVGVAGLGSQLSRRGSFAARVLRRPGTLIVVFLRGGMDGLSVVVPTSDPYLLTARPGIAVPVGGAAAARPRLRTPPVARADPRPARRGPARRRPGRVDAGPVPQPLPGPGLPRAWWFEHVGGRRPAGSTGCWRSSAPGTTFRAVGVGGRCPALAGRSARPADDVRSSRSSRCTGERRGPAAALAGARVALHRATTRWPAPRTCAAASTTAERSPPVDYAPPRRGYPDNDFGKALHERPGSSRPGVCGWRASTSAAGTCTPASAPSTTAT